MLEQCCWETPIPTANKNLGFPFGRSKQYTIRTKPEKNKRTSESFNHFRLLISSKQPQNIYRNRAKRKKDEEERRQSYKGLFIYSHALYMEFFIVGL